MFAFILILHIVGLRQNTCPKDFGRRCWGGAAGCKLVPLLALALTKGNYFFFAFALQDRPWETAMSLGFGLSIPTGPRVHVDEITVDEIAGKFDDMIWPYMAWIVVVRTMLPMRTWWCLLVVKSWRRELSGNWYQKETDKIWQDGTYFWNLGWFWRCAMCLFLSVWFCSSLCICFDVLERTVTKLEAVRPQKCNNLSARSGRSPFAQARVLIIFI